VDELHVDNSNQELRKVVDIVSKPVSYFALNRKMVSVVCRTSSILIQESKAVPIFSYS
jgi:hypothetical protein